MKIFRSPGCNQPRSAVGKGMGDDEVTLAKTDRKARGRLVEHYTPLVKEIASDKRHTMHADLDDLIQAGFVGLLRAVDGFTTGRDFDKYAARCIRHAVCASYGRTRASWEPPNETSLEQLMDDGFDVADEVPAYMRESKRALIHKAAAVAREVLTRRELQVIEAEMAKEPQRVTAERFGVSRQMIDKISDQAKKKIALALNAA